MIAHLITIALTENEKKKISQYKTMKLIKFIRDGNGMLNVFHCENGINEFIVSGTILYSH